MKKVWAILWIGVISLGLVSATTAYVANTNSLLIGPFPNDSGYNGLAKDYGWLKRLRRFNPFKKGNKGGGPTRKEPPRKGEQPQPQTVDQIQTTEGSIYFMNHHKALVNRRIREAKRHFEEKYNKEYTLPSERSQAHVLTHDGGRVKFPLVMEDRKFQKAVYGWHGSNVYGTVRSEEGFYVKEVKLFLKGRFDRAEQLARWGYGRKYTVKRGQGALAPPLAGAIGVQMVILALGFVNRKVITVGSGLLAGLTVFTGLFGSFPAVFLTLNGFIQLYRGAKSGKNNKKRGERTF